MSNGFYKIFNEFKGKFMPDISSLDYNLYNNAKTISTTEVSKI